jgi:hypothetical protein
MAIGSGISLAASKAFNKMMDKVIKTKQNQDK